MERDLPEQESDDSREGTLLHSYDADKTLDRSTLKPEHRDLLRISQALDEVIFRRVEADFIDYYDEVTEREVELNYLDIIGHPDLVRHYFDHSTVLVIDKKFGRRAQVPASLNLQLRTYAVMVAERVSCERVVVAITQPRAPYDERVTMAVYHAEDIVAARNEIDEILGLSRSFDGMNKLVAGEEQCRYCKAKIKCPAYAAEMKQLVIAPSDELEAKKVLDLATASQISSLLRAIKFADFIKDQVRDIARKMIADGRLDDWKLGKAAMLRKIVDPAQAIALLQLRGDLSRDEILDCSVPSLTKLREKLREKLSLTWKEANETLDQTLSPVIEVEEKRAPLILKT
jgi:hypothetical protein